MLIGVQAFPVKKQAPVSMKSISTLSYIWFKDEDMTVPTGTVQSVSAEIHRLQVLFPSYIFSTSLKTILLMHCLRARRSVMHNWSPNSKARLLLQRKFL